MAITVDYGAFINPTPRYGLYGIYNKFLIRITTNTARFKTSFRVRVTCGTVSYVLTARLSDIASKSAWINPVESLQERYFESQNFNAGQVFGNFVDTNRMANVLIEVGEFSAATANDAPTFLGYETEETFRFFNGFSRVDGLYRFGNARLRNTAFAPGLIPLPSAQKTLNYYPGENVPYLTSVFSSILGDFGGGEGEYVVQNVEYTAYDVNGAALGTGAVALPLTGTIGIRAYNYKQVWDEAEDVYPTVDKVEYFINYKKDLLATLYPTETLTIQKQKCDGRYPLWTILFTNKFGAIETWFFNQKYRKAVRVERGKPVVNDGINYDAVNFSQVNTFDRPQVKQSPTGVQTIFQLNSDFLTPDQVDAIQDFLESPYYMAIADEIFAEDSFFGYAYVQLLDQGAQIPVVTDELPQLTANFSLANNEPIHIS